MNYCDCSSHAAPIPQENSFQETIPVTSILVEGDRFAVSGRFNSPHDDVALFRGMHCMLDCHSCTCDSIELTYQLFHVPPQILSL